MIRSLRLAAIPIALLVLVALVAVALANRGVVSTPSIQAGASADVEGDDAEAGEADAPPTADEIARAAERLRAAGFTVEDAAFTDLATRYGKSGAVRLVAWSAETGVPVADIASMRDGTEETAPMGWGRIAKELGVRPGIGSIMGNGTAADGKKGDAGDGAGRPARPDDEGD